MTFENCARRPLLYLVKGHQKVNGHQKVKCQPKVKSHLGMTPGQRSFQKYKNLEKLKKNCKNYFFEKCERKKCSRKHFSQNFRKK
jgi:hypothetical protein